MKITARKIFLLLVVIFGYRAIEQTYKGVSFGLLEEAQYLTFILLIISAILCFINDVFINKGPGFRHFGSILALFLISVVVFRRYQQHQIDKSDTEFKALTLPQSSSTLEFDFKENGNIIVTEFSKLDRVVYYGKYTRSGDNIQIKKVECPNSETKLPTNGRIKGDTIVWDNFAKMIRSSR